METVLFQALGLWLSQRDIFAEYFRFVAAYSSKWVFLFPAEQNGVLNFKQL